MFSRALTVLKIVGPGVLVPVIWGWLILTWPPTAFGALWCFGLALLGGGAVAAWQAAKAVLEPATATRLLWVAVFLGGVLPAIVFLTSQPVAPRSKRSSSVAALPLLAQTAAAVQQQVSRILKDNEALAREGGQWQPYDPFQPVLHAYWCGTEQYGNLTLAGLSGCKMQVRFEGGSSIGGYNFEVKTLGDAWKRVHRFYTEELTNDHTTVAWRVTTNWEGEKYRQLQVFVQIHKPAQSQLRFQDFRATAQAGNPLSSLGVPSRDTPYTLYIDIRDVEGRPLKATDLADITVLDNGGQKKEYRWAGLAPKGHVLQFEHVPGPPNGGAVGITPKYPGKVYARIKIG